MMDNEEHHVALDTLCIVCLKKTSMFEKEYGEFVVCENCELEKKGEKIDVKAVLDKDGKAIGKFKEVHVEVPEIMEEIEYSEPQPLDCNKDLFLKCEECKFTTASTSVMLLHKQNQHQGKCCKICDCKTDVYNHKQCGILSCHSCEQFIRRQIVQEKTLVCVTGDNDCTITELTRANCQSCRYNRCVALGMDPSPVLKKLKKSKEDFEPNPFIYVKGKSAKKRKRRKTKSLDIFTPCAICSSLEVAHKHYGVDCCTSCKLFFVRNVSNDTQYLCVTGSDDCAITKANRTNCKSCRYKKCLEAGFSLDYKNYRKQRAINAKHEHETPDETLIMWDSINNTEEVNYEEYDNNQQTNGLRINSSEVSFTTEIDHTDENEELDHKHYVTEKDSNANKKNIVYLAKREPDNKHLGLEADENVPEIDDGSFSEKNRPDSFMIVKSEPQLGIKSEAGDLDPVKCEPLDSESSLVYQPEFQEGELMIKSVETDVLNNLQSNTANSAVKITKGRARDPLAVFQTSCDICQAEAPGQQFYGGVCCYSCRAFFRRAGGTVFICLTGDSECVVNQITRTNCKKCRYQRCLDAGMKPELVDRTLTKKMNDIKDPQWFSCNLCEISFSKQNLLDKHMQIKHQ